MPSLGDGRQAIIGLDISPNRVRDAELRVAMALLKTQEEAVEIVDLLNRLNMQKDLFLDAIERLQESIGIEKIRLGTAILVPTGDDRLKLAIEAVNLGATIEDSANALSWKEFESFCMKVLEENGYSCLQEFRYKSIRQKRFECDILATKEPLIVMADCKHYAGRVRGLRAVAKKQMDRVNALARNVSTMVRSIPDIVDWHEAIVFPVIITLFQENTPMIEDVPVVPGFKLNQFVQELPSNTDRIARVIVHPSIQKRLLKKASRTSL